MFFYSVLICITVIFVLFLHQYYLTEKRKSKTSQLPEMKDSLSEGGKKTFAKKSYYLMKKADFPDKTFPNNMLFWTSEEKTLDITWLARRIALDLDRVIGENIFYDKFIKKYESNTIDFIRNHFNDEEGFFMPNLNSWPCLYGGNTMIMISKQFNPSMIASVPLGRVFVEDILGKQRVSKLLNFIHKCENKSEDGLGFKETPYDLNPSVVATNTALSILWNLEEIPREINEIIKFLKRSYEEKEFLDRVILGSKNFPEDNRLPCSSMTHLSIKSFIVLGAFQNGEKLERGFSSRYKNFNFFIEQFKAEDEDIKKIIELYKSCKQYDSSFSAYPSQTPDEKQISDIYHTHSVTSVIFYAQEWVKKLEFNMEDILELNKLSSYIKECKADHGGYDLSKNGNKFSSVFGTRYALGLMLRLREIFGENFELDKREVLEIGNFLESCFDKKDGAFYAYPI